MKRLFRLPADLSPRVRKNTVQYYADISWWGLYAGSTVAFLTIYAARIGATPTQIGLLSALPALLALLLSLPFAGVVTRMGPHRATWLGAAVSRALLFLYALLPFFLPQEIQVWALIGIACLIAVPSILPGIGFPQLMIEALPADWRGYVIGARNAFLSIISFVVTLLCGQILTRMDFPTGYQVVFTIGGLGALLTAYHIYQVRPMEARSAVDRIPAPPPAPAPGPGGRLLPELNAQGRRFLRVLALLFLFNVANSMVNPLVPTVLVNRLRLSDAWISVGTAAGSLIVFGMSLYIAQALRRTGNRVGTAGGAALMALQAGLLAVAASPAVYLLSVLAGGVGQGILMSAQYNYHLEYVPEHDRPRWLSWSLLLGNAAVLLGSLGGPALAALAGAPLALGLLAVLRLLWGAALLRWG